MSKREIVLKLNYLSGNYKKEKIWIVGDGRSGTTWISELINYQKKYRLLFEPFHVDRRNDMDFFIPHLYMSPYEENLQLENICSQIFSGNYYNDLVDRYSTNFFYSGLLIKDIFANLFCYWASLKFSDLKIILLIRNPFAVALSKYNKKNWTWETSPLNLLNQPSLYRDYLFQFEDLIKTIDSKNDFILSQVLIWAIIHYIPIVQFSKQNIHIVFYEDINRNSVQEMQKIFNFINPESDFAINISNEIINQPSSVTDGKSKKNIKLNTREKLTYSWQEQLTTQQVDQGLQILENFGLERLYNQECLPNWDVIKALRKENQ